MTLLLASLLPAGSAHASPVSPLAGSDSISGRVNMPADFDVKSSDVRVAVVGWDRWPGWTPGWFGTVASTRVGSDGSFSFSGLGTQEYRLEVQVWPHGKEYLGGWYAGSGKDLAREPEGGSPVFAGTSNIEIELYESVPLTGVITLPAKSGSDRSTVDLMAYDITDLVRTDQGESSNWPWSLSGRGKTLVLKDEPQILEFTLIGHRRDAVLIVAARADRHFPWGYFHANADRLVGDHAHATRLTAGDHIQLTVRDSLASPKLSAFQAPRLVGETFVGETLTLEPGRWSLPDTTQRYQWLRDGQVIAGVTGTQYTLQAADLGATITTRVTVSKSGFPAATFDYSTPGPVSEWTPDLPDPEAPPTEDPISDAPESPIPGSPEEPISDSTAPEATIAPRVKGTARWGNTLRATPGTWDVEGVQVTYQWLRGGKAIKGATSARYAVTKKDIGKRLSVRATASVDGRTPGIATSNSRTIAKGKPKLTAKAKSVKSSARAKVVIRVKTAGLGKPTGTLRVSYGSTTLKVKLAAKRKGRMVVRLPRLAKGRYKVSVTFTPTAKTKKIVTKAASKKVTLRVR